MSEKTCRIEGAEWPGGTPVTGAVLSEAGIKAVAPLLADLLLAELEKQRQKAR